MNIMMQPPPFIVTRTTETPVGPDGDCFEPGFGRLKSLAPRTSDPDILRRLLRALSYSIRRHPTNLRAHVQTISLLQSQAEEEKKLYAAVAALFQVLEGRGAALRQRLLQQAGHLLEPDHQTQLQLLTRPGTPPAASEAPTELSLVTPYDHRSAAETDPVAYADELLCLGDYAEAMAVLEQALPREPDSEAIATALQAIYRSARDREAYERSRQLVLTAAAHAAELWPEPELFFGGR